MAAKYTSYVEFGSVDHSNLIDDTINPLDIDYNSFQAAVFRSIASRMGMPTWMMDELYGKQHTSKHRELSLRRDRPQWLMHLAICLEHLPKHTIVLSEQQYQSLMEWRHGKSQ